MLNCRLPTGTTLLTQYISTKHLHLYSHTHFVCLCLRCLCRPTAATSDEEPVAEQVSGKEQTTEETFPQTQACHIQREAQVHQLTYGSQ